LFRRLSSLFVFGDPVEAAKMHLDLSLNAGGPRVPDVHFDEMQEQDLRNAMAYLYAALGHALRQDSDEAMVEVLREWYDEAFIALAEVSEAFRENVIKGFVLPPGGPSVRAEYLELVRRASES